MNFSTYPPEETNTTSPIIARTFLLVYQIGVPLMMGVCVIAVAVNARCLAAIRWVRRPLSPTLQLSLSLAAADLYTALLHLLHIVFNSYLPNIWHTTYEDLTHCWLVAMEALRLGGIITIVLHLSALAANHHLGIVRPLRYPGIATTRNIRIILTLIWLVPAVAFLMHFSFGVPAGQGLKVNTRCPINFIAFFSFRLSFSMLLIIPLAFMCCAYAHILATVHAQTATWVRGSLTTGSCKHHGGLTRSRRTQNPQEPRRKLLINIRAVHTTLHILGSFVLMYLPAIISFLLVCPEDCRFTKMTPYGIWLNWGAQLLLIAKPLTNPIIYAARMHEVKEATRRMQAALRYRWCSDRTPGNSGTDTGGRSQPQQTTTATALCRIASNGSSNKHPTTVLLNNETTVL